MALPGATTWLDEQARMVDMFHIAEDSGFEEPSDEEFAVPIPERKSTANSAPVMAAMMLAVGEIIEPEKTHVEIAVEHAKPVDEDPFDLNFGDLPPLT